MDAAAKQVETRIRASARDICTRYLPPRTTDFALMFLPAEGLYAEVARCPGPVDALQRVSAPSPFSSATASGGPCWAR